MGDGYARQGKRWVCKARKEKGAVGKAREVKAKIGKGIVMSGRQGMGREGKTIFYLETEKNSCWVSHSHQRISTTKDQ